MLERETILPIAPYTAHFRAKHKPPLEAIGLQSRFRERDVEILLLLTLLCS